MFLLAFTIAFSASRAVFVCIMHACMLSCYSCVQLFANLWTVVHQAPLSLGVSRQEYWSGFPCPPPGDLPDPGIESTSPAAPTLQADFLPLSHLGSPCMYHALDKMLTEYMINDYKTKEYRASLQDNFLLGVYQRIWLPSWTLIYYFLISLLENMRAHFSCAHF